VRVVFFHRKHRHNVNFSIEGLFKRVRNALPKEVEWEVRELKYYSEGFFKRLYIAMEAAFCQGDINHITGDTTFIALFLRKKRTVLTMHDIGLLEHPNLLARFVLKLFWVVLPVKRSSIITTVSESTKRELLKVVRKDASRIQVVYVPISPLYIKWPKEFNKTKPTVLQIGTKHNKNVIRLVQALRGIPCSLTIVGELNDSLTEELERSKVDFCSFKNLSDEEVLEQYKAADILAFVSTYEGFGMPIVEANAVGRVVVTSNLLSMPEVAGGSAHLVDPFDVNSIRQGILKVIEDDAYREMLIMRGYENLKRFDVNKIAQQYASIYKLLEK
jgi:glycosyltransferase involved in cell wall biosynthesis